MSIHEKDSTITFEWVLEPTAAPLLKTDFDIALTTPNGATTYTDDGITTYVAPTATAQGKATYDLVASVAGRYQVTLSNGTTLAHTVHAKRDIYVVIVPPNVLSGTPPKTSQGPEILPGVAPSWGATGNTFDGDVGGSGSISCMQINPTGTKFYLFMHTEFGYEIDMDAYDLSTAVYNAVNVDFTASSSTVTWRWNGDGTVIWVADPTTTGSYLRKYTAPTPWSLSGVTYASVIVPGSVFTGFTGWKYNFTFGDNGNSIYVTDHTSLDKIVRFTLSIPYDPSSTVTATGQTLFLGTAPNNTVWREFMFNSDGTELWVEQNSTSAGVTGYAILVYVLSTPWNPSTAVYNRTDVTNGGVPGAAFVLTNDNYLLFKNNSPAEQIIEWQFG